MVRLLLSLLFVSSMLQLLASLPALAHEGCPADGENAGTVRCDDWEILYRNIDSLPSDKKEKAIGIVQESLPGLQDIDRRINLKMNELKEITYSSSANADELPRLGMDLQKLRNELANAIMQVNIRLHNEAGVPMQKPAGRGCRSMRMHHDEQVLPESASRVQ